MTRWIVAVTVMIVFLILCPLAFAEDASKTGSESESSGAKNWEFSLAPMYLWAVSIDGNMTVKGTKIDMDVPFSDIFDNLDGALTFHFEGLHKQRWGFFSDLNYIKLSPDDDGNIEIDYTQILAELGGFYRYTSGAHAFDGLAGLRYTSMKGELDFPGPLPEIDQSVDYTDPFFGMRWQWQIAEKWGLRTRGDIGGMGIGSDLTWNLAGLVNFKPWKHVALVGGYRVLYQNFSQGNDGNKFEFDATMHGPVLGLNITW
jgi:hypothetical protein